MEEIQIYSGVGWKEEILDKSLHICSVETIGMNDLKLAYVIRTINLRDLLTSSWSWERIVARELASLLEEDLPICGGSGVLGSKIFFAGGYIPSNSKHRSGDSNSVYVCDIHDPNKEIFCMPQMLNGLKRNPVMVESGGKLYALSRIATPNCFEVFDPDRGAWLALPPYPNPNFGSRYSYALAGTKLFVSDRSSRNKKRPNSVCCFDLAAQDPEKQTWKRVLTMCQGHPFPFTGNGLVVDLEDPNRKLLFALKPLVTNLVVYLMSLDEDQEDITEILEINLPDEFPHEADHYHFFHLGGNNVCLVASPKDYYQYYGTLDDPEYYCETSEDGLLILRGAAIHFQFEFDICKVNEDMNKCITVGYQPPCGFEYHVDPGPHSPPSILGCFLL